MTLLAPEPHPTAPPASSLAPAVDPAPGVSAEIDTVGAALLSWWDRLPRGRRDQLLSLADDLAAEEVLPRSVAADLQHLGVECPLTLVAEGGRQVRRALAPQALLDLLAQERPR
jgi:hypothetical protein